MDRNQIEARVLRIVSEQTGARKLNLAKKIRDDLGADSLDEVEIVMALEDEFEISISDEDARDWTTVGQIVESIVRLAA